MENELHFNCDEHFKKIISIPLVHAMENAAEYKHLHGLTLSNLSKLPEIQYYDVFYATLARDRTKKAMGIVIIFEDLLKPNVLFHFSSKFDFYRFQNDDEYKDSCQFFYWEEDGYPNIRFARPFIDPGMVRESSLFK